MSTPGYVRPKVLWACPEADPDLSSPSDFGMLVRRLRVRANLSQKELAERLGTTQSAVARMESGAVEPRIATLERLAEALGTELTLRVDGRASR